MLYGNGGVAAGAEGSDQLMVEVRVLRELIERQILRGSGCKLVSENSSRRQAYSDHALTSGMRPGMSQSLAACSV